MSVSTTRTCMPWANARCSAQVSAQRGVMSRSMGGSSALERNTTVRSRTPAVRNASRYASYSRNGAPIAANTTANRSPPPRTRAWQTIWVASRPAGSPAQEKIGSFCPRTSVFMPSIAETPVSMKSCGFSRRITLRAAPAIGRRASAMGVGKPSAGRPRPSRTRPSIARETPSFATSPESVTSTRSGAMPRVSSSTWIATRAPEISMTWPRRSSAPARIRTISPSRAEGTASRKRSGPAIACAPRILRVTRSIAPSLRLEPLERRLDLAPQRRRRGADRVGRRPGEPDELRPRPRLQDRPEGHARAHRGGGAPVPVEEELQHLERLVRRAGRVGWVVGALAQEALPQQARRLEHEPLRVLQGLRPDELRHLGDLALLLQELHGPVAQRAEAVSSLALEPVAEPLRVEAEGDAPVDRRVVPAVREVGRERPERARRAQRGLRHRLGEVAAGRRDRADDGDGALAAVERHDAPRPLVEPGEARGEVGRVPLLARHLLEARGDLAQRLRPARGRVDHERDGLPHVAEVLGDRAAGVDGRLARRDRHVGRVHDEHGPGEERAAR